MTTTEAKRERWARENAARYARLTPEQKAEKREKERQRLMAKRASESPEETEARRAAYRRLKTGYYPQLSEEARKARLEREERRRLAKIRDETPEETEKRRARYRESTKRANDRATPEQLEKRRLRLIERTHELKADIFYALGDECAGCGEQDARVLQVDHVNGGGSEHRRRSGGTHYWKVMLDYILTGSDEYQLLCANCHMIKSYRQADSL